MDKKERQLSSSVIRKTAGYSFTYRIKYQQMFFGMALTFPTSKTILSNYKWTSNTRDNGVKASTDC